MDTIDTSTMQQIEVEAARVAREKAEHEAAIAAERDAEAAILDRVIAIVKPALRAITDDHAMYTHAIDTFGGDCDEACIAGGHDDVRKSLVLCETHDEEDALYIERDGSLYESCFRATHRLDEQARAVTTRRAMDRYDLRVVIERILRALRADKRADATTAARERAATLAALAALVK